MARSRRQSASTQVKTLYSFLGVVQLEDRTTPSLGNLYYWLDGQKIPLSPVSDELAVRVSGADRLTDLTSADGRFSGYSVGEKLMSDVYVLKAPAGTPGQTAVTGVSASEWVTTGFRVDATGQTVMVLNEAVVALDPGVRPIDVFGGPEVVSWRPLIGTPDQFVVTLQGAGAYTLDYADTMTRDARVNWATPNFFRSMRQHFTPNDPLFPAQWHLNNTGSNSGIPGAVAGADPKLPQAWDVATGSGIVIAVLDDGIQTSHPDLAGNVFVNPGEIAGNGIDDDGNGHIDDVNGRSFITSGGVPTDPNPPAGNEHGTSVAGIAAGVGNNSLGITGAAFNARILPAQMFNGSTYVGDANTAQAIYYAAGRTADGLGTWDAADIINCSWGGGAANATLTNAFTWASTLGRGGLGVPVFISSGNGFSSAVSYPANLSGTLAGVMAVGASNDIDTRAGYSNYGPQLDFVAPSSDFNRASVSVPNGVATTTTDRTGTLGYNPAASPTGDYTTNNFDTGFGGTSSASPLAAGIGAVVLSANPALTASQLKLLLRGTADKVGGVVYDGSGFNIQYGYGRLNAFTAVQQTGLVVTTTTPAVGSVVNTTPTSFTVNFSRPLNTGTVQAGDFTVNGIPATGVTINDADTLTFTYAVSPVTTQGLQTMAIAAGAISSTTGNQILAFTGTFRYDVLALAVVSTNPPFPNGVFTLPGPFTYDVTFNEPVNPASVQTSDLTLSGIAGATVTGATVLAGNTTVRFTIGGVTAEGALTASIASGAITDAFGNAGSPFSAIYQVDFGTVPYPTPLTGKGPAGSRVYDPSVSGVINFVGDTDSFTINLDPNQKLTILVTPTSLGLQPRVELFDPANVSLGFAQASAPGLITGVQTFNITTGGVYRIQVSGAGSTVGGYTVQVVLNAALELEGLALSPPITNNTLATAQNINGAFRTETTSINSGSIGNVLGTTDNAGYSASAVAFAFEEISATGTHVLANQDDSTATISIPFTFNFYGSNFTSVGFSSNGLITFGGTDSSFTNQDLSASPTFAAIAPFWDDLFTGPNGVVWQVLGVAGSRRLVIEWDNATFFAGGSNTLKFEAVLFEGSNNIRLNYLNLNNGGSGSEGTSATVGIKGANPNANPLLLAFNNGPNAFVGSGKSTLISPPNPTPDLYSLTLAAGQKVTVGIAATTNVAGTLLVELLNSGGSVIATGVTGATNLASVISNFTTPVAGTYFVRVTGSSNIPYDVVVTKDAAFDTEDNNTAATAQNLTGTTGAFGAITTGGTAYTGVVVPPTFEDISTSGTVITALDGADDNTASIPIGFTFNMFGVNYTSLFVSSNGLITFGTGDSSFTNQDLTTSPTAAAIAPFWDDLFVTGDANSHVLFRVSGVGVNQHLTVQWNKISFFSGGTSGDTITFQAQLFADGRIQLNYSDLVSGSAAGNNGASATVGIKDAGTQGANRLLLAFNNGPNTFVGTGKSTLISQPPAADWYNVTLGAGQTVLQVETSTPGDGPGEFVNLLNPKVDVFDSTGTILIASGVVLGDGRNERVLVTGLTAGASYRVRVIAEASTVGEYFVSTTALRTPAITTKVDDATPFGIGPDGIFKVPTGAANGWTNVTGAGYLNDYTVHSMAANPAAVNFAQWDINITSLTPELFASWVARPQNATNATYQVWMGATLLSTIVVNQQMNPNDALFGSTLIESLGSFTVPSGTTKLTVRLLTLGANGDVVADGVFDPPTGEIALLGPAAGGETANTGSSVTLPDSMTKALVPAAPVGGGKPGVTVGAGVRPSLAIDGLGTVLASGVSAPSTPKLVSIGRSQTTPPESADAAVTPVTKPLAPVVTVAPPTAGWFGERIWVNTNESDEIIDLA